MAKSNDLTLLLKTNLKQLRLPTMLAEFEKLAREASAGNEDYQQYLLRTDGTGTGHPRDQRLESDGSSKRPSRSRRTSTRLTSASRDRCPNRRSWSWHAASGSIVMKTSA